MKYSKTYPTLDYLKLALTTWTEICLQSMKHGKRGASALFQSQPFGKVSFL